MVNEWGSGLQGEVTVKNTGTGNISGWTVRMVLPGGSSVSNLWGGSSSASSGSIAVANSNYNGTLASSSSATFGFLLEGSTAAASITSCTSS
jgi:cellulase/cellobiase CelA1